MYLSNLKYFYNAFEYDAMGNILTQVRHNRAGTKIEDMKYKYQYLDPTTKTKLQRNRLYHIYEPLSLSSLDPSDIDNMGAYDSTSVNINVTNNYVYDEEGRLVKDVQEGISKIVWRVDGKVKEIQRMTGSTKWLKFDYDAMGNRIAKHVYNNTGTTLERSTYYILDAQGNQISTYDHEVVGETAQFNLKERNIFGSSRIGSKQDSLNVLTATLTQNYTQVLGTKYYEFSNHLGNVLTVFSDVKIALDANSDNVVDGFRAPIRNTADYSPFGVQLDGRTISMDSYRRGFNGMEKDDEVKGVGNSYDFGARMYDARVGRWLTIDPLARKYPDLNPYNFVSNSPLLFVDPNGEVIVIHYKENGVDKKYVYTPGVKPAISNEFVQQVHEAVTYVMKNDDNRVFQTISNDKSTVNIVQTFTFEESSVETSYPNGFVYNPSTGLVDESTTSATISWNPVAMLSTTNGGGLAPSTNLLHEADHARGFLAIRTIAEFNAYQRTKEQLEPSDPNAVYDNYEEKRVIEGSEKQYIAKVNSKARDKWTKFGSYEKVNKHGNKVQATWWRTDYAQKQDDRDNHRGELVKSKGVNSISRADNRPVRGEKRTEGRFIEKVVKP